MSPVSLAALLGFFFVPALGQSSSSCSTTLTPTNSIQPSIASGYQVALVATGLTDPRSIEFDSVGNLLVLQAGAGIESLQLQDNGGTCVSVKSKKTVVQASAVSPILYPYFITETSYAAQSWYCIVTRWGNALRFFSRSSLFLGVRSSKLHCQHDQQDHSGGYEYR